MTNHVQSRLYFQVLGGPAMEKIKAFEAATADWHARLAAFAEEVGCDTCIQNLDDGTVLAIAVAGRTPPDPKVWKPMRQSWAGEGWYEPVGNTRAGKAMRARMEALTGPNRRDLARSLFVGDSGTQFRFDRRFGPGKLWAMAPTVGYLDGRWLAGIAVEAAASPLDGMHEISRDLYWYFAARHLAARDGEPMPEAPALLLIEQERLAQVCRGFDARRNDTCKDDEIIGSAILTAFLAMSPSARDELRRQFGCTETRADLKWPKDSYRPRKADRLNRLIQVAATLVSEIERSQRAAAKTAGTRKARKPRNSKKAKHDDGRK